ncbi:hypothetical protein SE17_33330 [Kouleothrix aurantiaca]|uniref:Uncharacterized protein n=1 Tax=Kouleothrix aurantiaca TaxID=186479 RepID=A0A0P9DHC2_9CHLR|nr:hypothetical protein SE17_33330 [Kouleothrix aurantiaca]
MQWHFSEQKIAMQACNGIFRNKRLRCEHAMAFFGTKDCDESMQWHFLEQKIAMQACNGIIWEK